MKMSRRILHSRAIRPCESISFNSLLNSLIHLCHSVCEYSAKRFFVNKKNARSSIRLIKNLLIFLQEIPNGISCSANSITLCLSELHFVLQKVLCLLEDCTRDDARLWMLMNSETASDEFRVLIRAMAVALDVLPLKELEVSDDVKELVEFVRNQALTLKFEVEVDDQRILRRVFLILDHFDDGDKPQSSDLRRVLNYLGIESWSECNREIKFLEGEISLEWQTEKKRDVVLVSSLMGFMIYSRSVMFEVVGKPNNKQTDDHVGCSEVIRFLNADDFKCPITLELMTDPVTIATGHTYEQSSILKWLNSENPTCPKTGERLVCTDLFPNLALKQLIKQFSSENGIHLADSVEKTQNDTKTVVRRSPAATKAMKLLANFLVRKLRSRKSREQSKAAYEIRLLSKTSMFNRSCLVEAGAIRPLLNLLFANDSLMQENAIASLLNLSKLPTSMRIIVDNGGLILILDILKYGLKMEARQHAAGTFFYLASSEECRMLIGEIPEIIPALIGQLRDGTERGKKNALATIFRLLHSPDNHMRVFAAGLVPLLLDLFRNSNSEDLVVHSVAVLAILADMPHGATAILSYGVLPIIIELLGSSNSMAVREYCLSLLLTLCIHNETHVLANSPSLMGTLYPQLTQGTSRVRKKASSLIKILHNFNERRSFDCSNSVIPQDRLIHVYGLRPMRTFV